MIDISDQAIKEIRPGRDEQNRAHLRRKQQTKWQMDTQAVDNNVNIYIPLLAAIKQTLLRWRPVLRLRQSSKAPLASEHKTVDQFLSPVRKEAAQGNVRWGVPYGMNDLRDLPLAFHLVRFGGTWAICGQKLNNALEDKKKPRTGQGQRDMSPGNEGDTTNTNAGVEFQYDADFSEYSTLPDSENDDEIENPEQVIDLVSRVPWYCWKAPTIPAGHFIWNCPGCGYAINFLKLTPKDVEPLGPEFGRYLRDKKWLSLREEMASHGFGLILVKKGEKTLAIRPGTAVVK
ncbi:hypothetical protein AMATHDRAFT_48221 [Amanita thiersii Skay4041]|uniref:Uncharacterized protein n=1 Tax=Amanita thiersii Skay4041 TaxID=703135 RepID=A0A2A9NP31_9AGAR|nr:hypothetical protein AMATHDRAFT_48221 [Amanita thiersii Skay4041]